MVIKIEITKEEYFKLKEFKEFIDKLLQKVYMNKAKKSIILKNIMRFKENGKSN